MNNFRFKNPVEVFFGKGEISNLSNLIGREKRVMMTYGGGSIFKNGVYDQVKNALKDHTVIEFGGIEANPDISTLIKAIQICKDEHIDFLLAVGGGSVIDGTKFIASAVKFDGDPWQILLDETNITDALPLGTVLTLPATGSEMNNGGVVSRRETKEKYPFHHDCLFPKFSILDPEVIYSLPKRQIANGLVDSYSHILEQYLTTANHTMVMDRWAEGLMKTIIELAPSLMEDEKPDYNDCADFMLTATMALNGFITMGVDEDWATHMIGHELTALHGLDHGVTLALVYPSLMHCMRKEKEEKLLQYGKRVFGIKSGGVDQRIDITIACTVAFFKSVGMKTRLSDFGIGEDTIKTIVSRFRERNWNLGENGIVTPEKVEEILYNIL